jgi:hypothetical protein
MSNGSQGARVYAIRVRGVLNPEWSDWFEGLSIKPQAGGETLMMGTLVDQAALHGLLNKIRDIGLPLLSVNKVEIKEDEGTRLDDLG